jgi:hypothetical protein
VSWGDWIGQGIAALGGLGALVWLGRRLGWW